METQAYSSYFCSGMCLNSPLQKLNVLQYFFNMQILYTILQFLKIHCTLQYLKEAIICIFVHLLSRGVKSDLDNVFNFNILQYIKFFVRVVFLLILRGLRWKY